MDPESAVKVTQLLQAAAALVLALRLIHFHLLGRLRAMFSLQIWTIVSSLGVFFLYTRDTSYFEFYVVSVPVNALVNIFAVRELFALVFDRYPGIRTMGRWTMYCAVLLALFVSLLQAQALWPKTVGSLRSLALIEVAERSVVLSLAVFILCILLFLSRYPVDLPRNFAVSSRLFCTIFLTETMALLVTSWTGRLHSSYIELAQTLVSCICLVSWAGLLEPMSASAQMPAPPAKNGSDQILLAQLESFNDLMSKAVRR